MFEYCADPRSLEGLSWLSCYLTTPKHSEMYFSILIVFGLLLAVVLPILILGFLGAGWITTLAQGAYTALQTSMEWAGVRDVSLSSSVFEICNDLLMEFTGVSTCESWWQHLSIRLVVRLNFRFDSACACIVQGMLLIVWGFIVLCLKAWQLAACWPYATCWLVCSLTCLKLE